MASLTVVALALLATLQPGAAQFAFPHIPGELTAPSTEVHTIENERIELSSRYGVSFITGPSWTQSGIYVFLMTWPKEAPVSSGLGRRRKF